MMRKHVSYSATGVMAVGVGLLLLGAQGTKASDPGLDGFLGFDADRGLFTDRMILQNSDKDARTWGVHLNKSFLETGPVGNPANFSYSKSGDEDSQLNYDMAIRLELGDNFGKQGGIIPDYTITPCFGAELHRQEGKDANDSRQYFGVLSIYPNRSEDLSETDPMFLIGGAYVDDVVNDSEGAEWILEYRPWKPKEEKTKEKAEEKKDDSKPMLVRLATLIPDEREYIVPFDFQLIPMLAVDVLTADPKNPVSTDTLDTAAAKKLFRDAVEDRLDNQFLRYGFQLKMSLFKRIEISYDLAQRHVIDDFSEDHLYQEVNASVKLGKGEIDKIDDLNALSAGLALNLTYSKGENLPTLKDEDKLVIGLGVKF